MFSWNVLSPLVQEGNACSFFEIQPKGHQEALLNVWQSLYDPTAAAIPL